VLVDAGFDRIGLPIARRVPRFLSFRSSASSLGREAASSPALGFLIKPALAALLALELPLFRRELARSGRGLIGVCARLFGFVRRRTGSICASIFLLL
jgi:hypothetical protein